MTKFDEFGLPEPTKYPQMPKVIKMNERIRKLAEQAGMTDDKFGMFFAKDFDSHCADGVDLEKFAELIVRECAKLADKESSYPYSSYGLLIREQFGVKE